MLKTIGSMIFIMAVMVLFTAPASWGGYDSCTPCHNNRTAPDLRGRFENEEQLVRAARNSKDPQMFGIRQNERLLRAAAKDLGLE